MYEMDFTAYSLLARRTMPAQELGEPPRLLNYALGLAGESGEAVEVFKKVFFHGHELDPDQIIKELGDVLWYINAIAVHLEVPLGLIASRNIKKLMDRYPDGFSIEASKERTE